MRTQWIFTIKPDETDRAAMLADHEDIRGVADALKIPHTTRETGSGGETPYIDLIVSVPDILLDKFILQLVELAVKPTSDVLCETAFQAKGVQAMGYATDVCLVPEREDWEKSGVVFDRNGYPKHPAIDVFLQEMSIKQRELLHTLIAEGATPLELRVVFASISQSMAADFSGVMIGLSIGKFRD